jgi:hypothetical protein
MVKATRITIVVFLLVVALLVGGFAMWRASMRRAFNDRIQTLRLAGEPTRPEDLSRPPVPEEENAVDIFLEAWRLSHQTSPPDSYWELPDEREDWSEENWREVAAWVETRRPFLELLRKGVARPHVRLPGNPGPWDEDLDEPTPRTKLTWLMMESQRVLLPAAHLHLDRPDGTEPAVRALILHLDVVDRVADRWSIRHVFRMRCYAATVRTLEELTHKPGFDAGGARILLRGRLEVIEDREPLRRALRYERVAMLWLLSHPERMAAFSSGGETVGGFPATWIGNAFVWRNAPRTLDLIECALAVLDRPDHETSAAMVAMVSGKQTWIDRICALGGMWDIALSMTLAARLQAVTETRLARIGLALLEHRQETGAWPESLAAIGERVDGAIPVDPYTGEAFLYERDDKTVRIISAGDGSGPVQIVTDSDEDPRLRWELTR